MAEATDNSWKDEFALVVLLTPTVLVFIPGMRDHVNEGFAVLSTLPDWYQYLIIYCDISIVWNKKPKMLRKK